jgi:hypothetical protein
MNCVLPKGELAKLDYAANSDFVSRSSPQTLKSPEWRSKQQITIIIIIIEVIIISQLTFSDKNNNYHEF